MFIVTVTFNVKTEYISKFMKKMKDQAVNSLSKEKECHRFDIGVDPKDRSRIFLYEIYSTQASFDVHLGTDHYLEFSNEVDTWVDSKTVETWNLEELK